MTWISCEPGYEGAWTEEDLYRLFMNTVSKDEYPDFDCWIWDMERNQTLFRHEGALAYD